MSIPATHAATPLLDLLPSYRGSWPIRCESPARSHIAARSVTDRQSSRALVESAPHRRRCEGRGIASHRGRDWGLLRTPRSMPPQGRAALTSIGRSWGKAWRIRNVAPVASSRRTTCPAAVGATIRSARFPATSRSWFGAANLPVVTTGRAASGSRRPAIPRAISAAPARLLADRSCRRAPRACGQC